MIYLQLQTHKLIQNLCVLALCLSVSSCFLSEPKFDQIVRDTYEQCADKNQCVINFKTALNLDWNTMYVFADGAENAALDVYLDFKYEKAKFGKRLILFVKNKKIIYEQLDPWHSSDHEKNPDIVFKTKSHHLGIDKEEAKFQIHRKSRLYVLEKI